MISVYYSKAHERAIQALSRSKTGAWVISTAPDDAELDTLAATYQLDRDNLADAVDIYESPRIEVDGDKVYIYVRYCYPEGKEIATEPLLIVYSPDYLITVMRRQTGLLDRLTSDTSNVVTTQKTKTLMQILSEINRSYEQQVNKAAKQIYQIRVQMRQSQISNRDFIGIIELEEDLNEFLSALQPQSLLLNALVSGKYLRLYEQDRDIIEDLERSTTELIVQCRTRMHTLMNMRQAYDAIATNNLNNIFKRLTSIAIFLAIPTVLTGIWGMNVGVPGEGSLAAFWWVLGLMAVFVTATVLVFRRKKWL